MTMAARSSQPAHGRRTVATLVAAFATVSVIALHAGMARADGLRRLDAAWLVPSRLATDALWGEGHARSSGAWVRAGQARLYGLAELPVRRLAAGLAGAGRAWALEAGWEAAGSGTLHDDRLDGRLTVGRRLRVGARVRWRRLLAGAGPRLSDRCWDLEAGLSTTAGVFGDVQADLAWPLLRSGDAALAVEPATRLRLALGGRGRAVALGLDMGDDGRPALGWEALCGLSRGLGISWRVDRTSGSIGVGLLWRRGPLRLRTSHLAHPELGLTHRFELTVGAAEAAPW